jgi:hypothetical protein
MVGEPALWRCASSPPPQTTVGAQCRGWCSCADREAVRHWTAWHACSSAGVRGLLGKRARSAAVRSRSSVPCPRADVQRLPRPRPAPLEQLASHIVVRGRPDLAPAVHDLAGIDGISRLEEGIYAAETVGFWPDRGLQMPLRTLVI